VGFNQGQSKTSVPTTAKPPIEPVSQHTNKQNSHQPSPTPARTMYPSARKFSDEEMRTELLKHVENGALPLELVDQLLVANVNIFDLVLTMWDYVPQFSDRVEETLLDKLITYSDGNPVNLFYKADIDTIANKLLRAISEEDDIWLDKLQLFWSARMINRLGGYPVGVKIYLFLVENHKFYPGAKFEEAVLHHRLISVCSISGECDENEHMKKALSYFAELFPLPAGPHKSFNLYDPVLTHQHVHSREFYPEQMQGSLLYSLNSPAKSSTLKPPNCARKFTERPLVVREYVDDQLKFVGDSFYYNDEGEFFFVDTNGPMFMNSLFRPTDGGPHFDHVLSITPIAANYYHCMIQLMTVLSSLQDDGFFDRNPSVKMLINQPRGYLFEGLDLLGISRDIVVPFELGTQAYTTNHLTAPYWPRIENVNHPTTHIYHPPRWALQKLRSKFVPEFPKIENRTKIIYTSRSGVTFRGVYREDILLAHMKEEFGDDFVVFTVGAQTLQAQIELFSHARVIIAPHGAALSNMLYCAPGTKIIEFPTESMFELHFATVAAGLDMDFWVMPSMYVTYYSSWAFSDENSREVVRAVRAIL